MKNIVISIIVPCYNQAQYLDEALQSVLDQTYKNWECIIVNDGSPDDTEEIAQKWITKDNRFKYLYKENGGLSSARNAGIEIAHGEWVLPLDADDKITTTYLQLAEQQFDNGYKIIYCEAEYFGAKTEIWSLPKFSLLSLAKTNIIFCSAIFQKSDWKKVNGYDIKMKYGLEDWEFWISILKNTSDNAVYKIPSICFYYRIKEISMINDLNRSENKQTMLFYIEKKHLEFFHHHLGSIHLLNHKIEEYKTMIASATERNKQIINSKRYMLVENFLKIFGK